MASIDPSNPPNEFPDIVGPAPVDAQGRILDHGNMRTQMAQCYANAGKVLAQYGATLDNVVEEVVYVTDMFRFRPLVNKVQEELWGNGPYPPRTIVEVHRLNQDDIFEVEGTFYAPVKK